jgi:polysaccharide biosynthesis transport protein
MELREYLNVLLRRKWVVIITLIVTLLVVTVGTFLISPTYVVTTTLRIATAAASSSNSSDYNYADRLLNTYVKMAASNTILEQLKQQLNLEKLPAIDVTAISGTELIEITIEGKDPDLAVNEANTLTSIIIAKANEFYSGSGKSSSEILKVQVDQAESDLNQARADYYATLNQGFASTDTCTSASQDVNLKQQIYSELLTQYEELVTQEALQANLISVVDPAVLPEFPSKPNKPLNIALGFMVGLVAGLGLAFLYDNLDSTLFSSEDITNLSKMNLIGKIPFNAKKNMKEFPLDGNAEVGEAFLRLKTNLLPLISDPPLQTILITSSMPSEGKSTIVAGLAHVLAQSGKKVIVVECDLRIPGISKIFNLQNKTGLSDYLMGKVPIENIIQETNFVGLQVITSGHPTKDPVQLLDSIRMKTLPPVLLHRFDYVLLDSPSVVSVTDTSILAPMADGVLFVAKPTIVRKEKLKAALDQLAIVKAKLIGIVINGEDSDKK